MSAARFNDIIAFWSLIQLYLLSFRPQWQNLLKL